jgi:hypothetical protein
MLRQLAIGTLRLGITVCICLATTSTSRPYPQTPGSEGQSERSNPPVDDPKILLPRYRQLSNLQPPNNLSAETGSWLLYLQRSGGLDGTTQSQLIITSEGDISIIVGGPADGCTRRLPDKLDELATAIKSARLPESSGIEDASAKVSLCHDCYRTTLAVYHRGEGGLVSGYEVYWDDITVGSLAKEIHDIQSATRKIRNIALKACKKRY